MSVINVKSPILCTCYVKHKEFRPQILLYCMIEILEQPLLHSDFIKEKLSKYFLWLDFISVRFVFLPSDTHLFSLNEIGKSAFFPTEIVYFEMQSRNTWFCSVTAIQLLFFDKSLKFNGWNAYCCAIKILYLQ